MKNNKILLVFNTCGIGGDNLAVAESYIKSIDSFLKHRKYLKC